jgi:hypothetical protein
VIERVDDDLTVVAVMPLPIPASFRAQGYDHVGDIDVVDNVIYVPFEQPHYELGHQVTARYDATKLAFIDAVELAQHENSFVTVDPATMIAYSMDHFDGDSLFRYDVNNGWAPLPPLPMTMTLHHTQGADVADGAVWIATSDDHNGAYRVDIATGDTTSVGTLGHDGAEGEGFDATPTGQGAFHALVNAPRQATVFFDHYDLTDATTTGDAKATADTADTQSTAGASRLAATGERPWWLWAGVSALAAIAAGTWLRRRRHP